MLSFIAERSREDAVALVRPGGEAMTFASLAMAAAAVVQAIEARAGEVAGRVVALATSDGAQSLAAVLGVLEAGGVALPLDGKLPLAVARKLALGARAVALVVGDAAEDRLDVEPIDPARQAWPADATLALATVIGAPPRIWTRAELQADVDATVETLALAGETRLALLPSTLRWLVPALALLRAGGTLVDVAALEPAAMLATLAKLDGKRILGTPSELDRLARARRDQDAPRPNFERIDVVTSAIAAPLQAIAAQAFEGVPLVKCMRSADSLRFAASAPAGAIEADGEFVDVAAFEAALRARPDVREAAALLVPDEAAGQKLVAFVSAADAHAAAGGERAAAAGGKIAAAPARVVTLGSLPHAADGAVDREALRRMASPQ
jgi:hypothetical protein